MWPRKNEISLKIFIIPFDNQISRESIPLVDCPVEYGGALHP